MIRESGNELPEVAQRFLRYVVIDTESAEGVKEYPSTEKQKVLGKLLVQELTELDLDEVKMDDWGYVTATLPARSSKNVPVIGLIAHMDTSPEVPGGPVKAIVHKSYKGGRLDLSGNPELRLDDEVSTDLAKCIGHDIITSDGTTLLGADNKAGIAEIIEAVRWFIDHPEVPRGRVRIAFTCDEEVGRGTDYFDIAAFGADFAYTVDGEGAAQIENETFCADAATVTISGRNMHPGYAKGKLINSMKAAASFISLLPGEAAPETTDNRQGYLHPISVSGTVEQSVLRFIVRDFEVEGLKRLEDRLFSMAAQVEKLHEGAHVKVEIKEQYRNMRTVLSMEPRVVEYAMEAARKVGLDPVLCHIRGGTDGARLSYKGLLTPNMFTGGRNFHSRTEWISVQEMEQSVKTLIALVRLWEERA